MAEPSEESMLRAETALLPFVRGFNLPVNPEELELMAYAVLKFANSADKLTDITHAVDEMISDHLAARDRMIEAMEASTRERKRSGQADGV